MNFSQFYKQHAGDIVKVVMTDGEVFCGVLFGYISAEDNAPDPESIVVVRTELYTNEIASIEISKD